METSSMIKLLQDPMGLPFHPIVFQILMVFTFALHITFVNFTLGASALAVYGHLKGNGRWKELSKAMAKAVPVNVSLAVLLGVAPLLFVQTLYDPFWYASFMLSAGWAMAFVFIMMTAYGFSYILYLRGRKGGEKGLALFGIISFALFLLAGVIMHSLGYQLLQPEKWMGWYTEGGALDTSGGSLHSFHLSRFLHFIAPSFAMAGVLLMLYSWYFRKMTDMDRAYLDWTAGLGARLAFLFTMIQTLVGFWWLLSLPPEFRFSTNPYFLFALGLGIGLLFLLYAAQNNPVKYAAPAAVASFITIFGMSLSREALRGVYLARFDYSIFNYKVSLDIGSTALFFSTFIVGVSIAAYFVAVAFKTGRTAGKYEAGPGMQAWGRASIGLLIAWILVVAGLGVAVTVRNFGN